MNYNNIIKLITYPDFHFSLPSSVLNLKPSSLRNLNEIKIQSFSVPRLFHPICNFHLSAKKKKKKGCLLVYSLLEKKVQRRFEYFKFLFGCILIEKEAMKNSERLANVALAGLTLAPLVAKVDPNVNVILTACLTVFVGCYRSVKPTPPSETMSNEHAMRFPLIGSAMLLSLFLLFKFLSKDLVNAVLTCYFFVLGIVALSATLLPAIKRFLPNHWNEDLVIWRFPYIRALEVEFTRSQVVAAIPGAFFCAWYASQKHWLANNILGLAFCIQGIEMLSLGSFKTGAILLAGLFVYDIFWVFFTPVMVSVAKSFDAPIKLLFPTADSARPFSMLGLGDIVIPGIFVALALRFDVSRGKQSQYFKSAFLGYAVGLILTIIVMNWFQAAQPALLYIVPAVIGFLAVHVIWNGEVKPLLEFDESKATSSEDGDDKLSKKVE